MWLKREYFVDCIRNKDVVDMFAGIQNYKYFGTIFLCSPQESPSTVSGIYIKSVLPDSPAALSQRLRAGDRILAVNGLSLAGVDYQT